MKTKTDYIKLLTLCGVVIAAVSLGRSAKADTFFRGFFSSDWADPANGNAIIMGIPPWGNYPCIVSNAGNYTAWGVYLANDGGGMSIVSGGELRVAASFQTGQWIDNLPLDVTGGQLIITNALNIGAGGYDGKVNISGGTVQAQALTINSAGGANMNISSNGTYITGIGQLANINNQIANNRIVANANTAGWSINVDTNTIANMVLLTAVYVAPPASTNFVFNNGGGDNAWTNQLNWNPVGHPGLSDTATVGSGLSATLNSAGGIVDELMVGSTNGAGSVSFNTGCLVSFHNANISLIVGGITNSGVNPSACIFNGGSVSTVGDLVLGGNGGRADVRHYGGTCLVGGTLRLGSYLYPGDASPTNASLRLIGSSGGFTGIHAIEIGNAGTLSYEFNGGSAIKTLNSSSINILPGAELVVDGTGYSGLTTVLKLMKASTLTGTFTTVILTNFANSVTPSVSYTATTLLLSLVNTQPSLGLSIQSLGGGTNQVTWSYGNIETATNVNGPWQQLDQCAASPLVQAATNRQMFYRGMLSGAVYSFDNDTGNNQWGYASNWNPDGTPSSSDTTVIDNSMTVFMLSDAGTVDSVTVGTAAGSGSLVLMSGASVVFANPCKSVIIGGAGGPLVNYYTHGAGTGADANLSTVGDFVFGSSGAGANAWFEGPGTLSIGGTLRLGSYMSPAYSYFQLLGAVGTVTAGGLEVGSVGDLQYNFNGDANLNTLLVSGNVSLQSGSTLTINGANFVGGTGAYGYTLIQGGSLTGTFTTVHVTGFPAGVTAVASYSGANVNLVVTVP